MPTGRDVGTRIGGRVTYAPDTDRGRRATLREHEAATAVGLATGWRNDLPVPFPHAGGVVLADQAQLDPMELLHGLVAGLRAAGGRVVTGVRVQHVSECSCRDWYVSRP